MIFIEPPTALALLIDERLRVMLDYWRPVWLAVRDHGCACAIIVRGDGIDETQSARDTEGLAFVQRHVASAR